MSQKSRILYTLKYLYENSDEQHQVTAKDISEYLESQGLTSHRTTINGDIELICEIGIDIVSVRSSPKKYFMGSRMLESVELKMLTDAIVTSKFITRKKSQQLIEKISKLGSVHMAEELNQESDVNMIHKPTNEKIYYTIDTIKEAIQKKIQVTFNYLEYTLKKVLIYKYDGYTYQVSPYTTFWKDAPAVSNFASGFFIKNK